LLVRHGGRLDIRPLTPAPGRFCLIDVPALQMMKAAVKP